MNNLCIRTHNQVRKPQAPFCTGLHSFLSSSYTIFNPLFTAPTQLQWHGWPRPFSSSVQTLLALSTDRRIFNHAFLHFCYPVLLGKMVVRHPTSLSMFAFNGSVAGYLSSAKADEIRSNRCTPVSEVLRSHSRFRELH